MKEHDIEEVLRKKAKGIMRAGAAALATSYGGNGSAFKMDLTTTIDSKEAEDTLIEYLHHHGVVDELRDVMEFNYRNKENTNAKKSTGYNKPT